MGKNLRAELENDSGAYPSSWRPKEGSVIVGKIIRYQQATTNYPGSTENGIL